MTLSHPRVHSFTGFRCRSTCYTLHAPPPCAPSITYTPALFSELPVWMADLSAPAFLLVHSLQRNSHLAVIAQRPSFIRRLRFLRPIA